MPPKPDSEYVGTPPPPKTRQQLAREWNAGVNAAIELGMIAPEAAEDQKMEPSEFEGPDEDAEADD